MFFKSGWDWSSLFAGGASRIGQECLKDGTRFISCLQAQMGLDQSVWRRGQDWVRDCRSRRDWSRVSEGGYKIVEMSALDVTSADVFGHVCLQWET